MDTIKKSLPEYAKDLKLNYSSVIENAEGAELTTQQIAAIALACSYATKNAGLIKAIEQQHSDILDEKTIYAAKAAASIMAMNNIYYRAMHLMSDKEYLTMPAKLRMNVIGNPGIDKVDFELMSLAISAINGCGMCIDSHASTLIKSGLEKSAIQYTIRISAVINGIAQVLEIENGQTQITESDNH
jgi:lipoyl-dependent peroxiredoxin subunit D